MFLQKRMLAITTSSRRTRRATAVLVPVVFAVLAVWFTWPAARYLRTGIPYVQVPEKHHRVAAMQPGDHLQIYYQFWTACDYLRTGGDFFHDPYEFACRGAQVRMSRMLFFSLVFTFYALCLGPVAAYNLLAMTAVFLSGLMAFLLARRLRRGTGPALVAGIVYACLPFETGQLLGGHTNGFVAWMMPALFLGILACMETGRVRYAALCLPLLFSYALVEYHLLYYSFLFGPAFAAVLAARRVLGARNRRAELRRALKPAAALLALFALAAGLMLHFQKDEMNRSSTLHAGRPAWEVANHSPHGADLFRRENSWFESHIYLGIPSLGLAGACAGLLAALAFSAARKGGLKAFWVRQSVPLYFLAVFLLSALLTLGLSPRHTPYLFCYKHLPYFNYIRNSARIFVMTGLSMALLAAYALGWMRRWLRARLFRQAAPLLSFACAALIVWDFHPQTPAGISLMDEQNPLHRILREQCRPGQRVLYLPMRQGDCPDSSLYLYYATLDRIPMLNGYYPIVPKVFTRDCFSALLPLNAGLLSEAGYELLRRENVGFLVVYPDALGKENHAPAHRAAGRLLRSPYLELIRSHGGALLLGVRSAPVPTAREPEDNPVTGVLIEAGAMAEPKIIVPDPEASRGQALLLPRTRRPGMAVYDRRLLLASGIYTVWLRLRRGDADPEAGAANRALLTLDVLDGRPAASPAPLAHAAVRADALPGSEYVCLPFTVASPEPFLPEIHLTSTGAADLYLDTLYLLHDSQRDPLTQYAARDAFLPSQVSVVGDPGAEGGQAVAVFKSSPGRETFTCVSGPYRRYPAGRYRLRVRLKALNIEGLVLGRLRVTSGWGKTKIAARQILAEDFEGTGNGYRDLALPFSLDRDMVLEFRVEYGRACDLYVDSFRIDPEP